MIARMQVSHYIERFLEGRGPIGDDMVEWPAAHRSKFLQEFARIAAIAPPGPNETIVIDSPPCRVFRWQRPGVPKIYFPLASRALADVVKHIDLRAFTTLFSALLLEKTIIVYHTDEAIVNNAILALHFILRPLRWVSGSISILPEQLTDLLNAPNPLLVGLDKPLTVSGSDFVYFNLVAQDLHVLGPNFPLYPKYAELEMRLRAVWAPPPKGHEPVDYTSILAVTSSVVGLLMNAVDASIMSDMTGAEAHSLFLREFFLPRFPREEQPFAQAFSETQMFQLQVEHACRRRSDERSIEL